MITDGQYQKTLRDSISFVGIGLHSGAKVRIRLRPSEDSSGIHFLRRDVAPGTGLIPARWFNVHQSELCTVLINHYGSTIATVEHLLAALFGCGVDNALVEVDGPEVPIMDGSAAPYSELIARIGTRVIDRQRHAIRIERPIELREGDKYAILMPSPTPRISVSIDFPGTPIGFQTFSVELTSEAFHESMARARTFGFKAQLEALRRKGLTLGGSLNNAVLIDGDRIVNEDGLRFNNEFVRHKILDVFGDLALAGIPIIGHYYAHKPGHALNQRMLEKLFAERSSWSYTSLGDPDNPSGSGLTRIRHQDPEFWGGLAKQAGRSSAKP